MPLLENPLTLADWRRRVVDLYTEVRNASHNDIERSWWKWRTGRDLLLKTHAQSPLNENQRFEFQALNFFDYDPDWRVTAEVQVDLPPKTYVSDLGDDGETTFTRIAQASFHFAGKDMSLHIYWIEGYGGGLFIPFRDVTNGLETFGGGRYLIDSIKGSDYGVCNNGWVLDFNFAYNPSCAYHSRWLCPLAPPENHLPVEVRAGERSFEGG